MPHQLFKLLPRQCRKVGSFGLGQIRDARVWHTDRRRWFAPLRKTPCCLLSQHLTPRQPSRFEIGWGSVNGCPADAQRPEALRKKSRSTTNSPIFACSFSSASACPVFAASARPENTTANPSRACFFQPLISV